MDDDAIRHIAVSPAVMDSLPTQDLTAFGLGLVPVLTRRHLDAVGADGILGLECCQSSVSTFKVAYLVELGVLLIYCPECQEARGVVRVAPDA